VGTDTRCNDTPSMPEDWKGKVAGIQWNLTTPYFENKSGICEWFNLSGPFECRHCTRHDLAISSFQRGADFNGKNGVFVVRNETLFEPVRFDRSKSRVFTRLGKAFTVNRVAAGATFSSTRIKA